MTLPWDEAGWQETVDAWIDDTLAELEIERAGAVDHFRSRPWAALARVATAEGDLYFKADAPSEAYEPALTEWLAARRPALVAEVLRADARRGWLLTRDAGRSLRDHIVDPPDAAIWSDLLPLYAELQIELAPSLDELLALGVPDSRPGLLAQIYEDLVSRWPAAASAPAAEVAHAVDRLGETVPSSLAHEELQDHNILLRNGAPVVIDWAEAVVEHPFCGLVNTFRGLVDRWGFEAGTPELTALRDAYLEPWTTYAPLPRLAEVFEAAYALGMLCRAVSWDRLLAVLPAHDRGELEDFVPAWLEMAADAFAGKARLGS